MIGGRPNALKRALARIESFELFATELPFKNPFKYAAAGGRCGRGNLKYAGLLVEQVPQRRPPAGRPRATVSSRRAGPRMVLSH